MTFCKQWCDVLQPERPRDEVLDMGMQCGLIVGEVCSREAEVHLELPVMSQPSRVFVILLCRGVLDWNMAPSSKVNKVLMADMGYPIDPHSLYKAIAWSSQLGLPMYVMENGAPFDKDDTRRTEWINCALEQVLCSFLSLARCRH